MSKFATVAQAERVVDGRRSAVAVLCAVDQSSGDAVETDSYGAGQPVTGARLKLARARRGAA